MSFAVTKQAQRWLMPIFAVIMAFQLAGCGDNDKEQRKAFIDYLQNTVMRGSITVPTLSEDQKQKLGNYVSDYAILVTFSQNFSRSMDSSLIRCLPLSIRSVFLRTICSNATIYVRKLVH